MATMKIHFTRSLKKKDSIVKSIHVLDAIKDDIEKVIPTVVHLVKTLEHKVTEDTTEMKKEVNVFHEKVMKIEKWVGHLNVFGSVSTKIAQILKLATKFIDVVKAFEDLKSEMEPTIKAWRDVTSKIKQGIVNVESHIKETIDEMSVKHIQEKLHSMDIHKDFNIRDKIHSAFKKDEKKEEIKEEKIEKKETHHDFGHIVAEVKEVASAVQTIVSQAHIIPGWIVKLDKAKDSLFELAKEMEVMINEINDAFAAFRAK